MISYVTNIRIKNIQETILIIFIIILASILRLNLITQNPPGLYPDEVAIGSNAHMILTTGLDQYGVKYPLWFESFGDYKMPVYIYLTSFAMDILGKNELSVRVVSAIAGIATIIIFYLLLLEFKSSINKATRIFAVVLLTISPWHIHFSRGGFEANLALAFFLLGILFLTKYVLSGNSLKLLMALIFITTSVYTYHTYRIIAPLTFLTFAGYLFFSKRENFKYFIFVTATFFLSILPNIYFSIWGKGSERVAQTTAIDYNSLNHLTDWIVVPFILFNNYISHFSLDFLFINGDGFGRHQIEGFGQMFKWQAPFLILGLFALIKNKNTYLKFLILFLLIVTPVGAMFTSPSPHAIRSLLLVIPLSMLVALGINLVIQQFAKFKYLLIVVFFVAIYEFSHYLHYYYVHYPQNNKIDWDSGNKEIVLKTQELTKANEKVYVNGGFIDPLYFYFYGQNIAPIFIETVSSINSNEDSIYIRQFREVNKPMGEILYKFKLRENYEIEFIYLRKLSTDD